MSCWPCNAHTACRWQRWRVHGGAAGVVTLEGPPEMIMPFAKAMAAAGVSLGRTSA